MRMRTWSKMLIVQFWTQSGGLLPELTILIPQWHSYLDRRLIITGFRACAPLAVKPCWRHRVLSGNRIALLAVHSLEPFSVGLVVWKPNSRHQVASILLLGFWLVVHQSWLWKMNYLHEVFFWSKHTAHQTNRWKKKIYTYTHYMRYSSLSQTSR